MGRHAAAEDEDAPSAPAQEDLDARWVCQLSFRIEHLSNFQNILFLGRLKKLGFGTRLIDQVLKESIEASGRKPCEDTSLSEGSLLKKNIEILLEWTIPEDYMNTFREANKSVEEILEELAN